MTFDAIQTFHKAVQSLNIQSLNIPNSKHRLQQQHYLLISLCIWAVACLFFPGKESTSSDMDTISSLPSLYHRRLERRALSAPKSTKFPPVSCHEVFAFNRNLQQNVSDPNRGRLNGRYTNTEPPFWISLHNSAFDGTRWAIMDFGYYYENEQTKAFVDVLRASPESQLHVVDVGGNIGWYSLQSVAAALSANKSIVVDVFEPNPRNRLRLCESLMLNNWVDHSQVSVNIYPVGVSSTSGGLVKMGISDSGTGKLGVYDEANKTETVAFPLVSLDDLADELNWNGATILKVDVEGLELDVFQGAKRFLGTGRVQNIFFEGNSRTDEETAKFKVIVRLLLQSGSYAYMYGSWMGPNTPLDAAKSETLKGKVIGDEVINQYMENLLKLCRGSENTITQCNLWWRPRSMS